MESEEKMIPMKHKSFKKKKYSAVKIMIEESPACLLTTLKKSMDREMSRIEGGEGVK